MKRFLIIAVAFALVLGACGGTDGSVVASVNGKDITDADVQQLVPETDTEISSSEFARYLSLLVQWEGVAQAAFEEFGVQVSDEEIDARVAELVAENPETESLEEYLGSVGATESGIRAFARQLEIQVGVELGLDERAEPIGDDVVNRQLVESPRDWTVVCASHILVATEEEATTVSERLEAGEDFATLAEEVSIDAGSAPGGGDLGCTSPTDFVESFAAATMEAEIGVPTAAVESTFGFHIVLVAQREEATPDVVREALAREALVNALSEWFNSLVENLDVTVDESVGVWVTDPSPQVLANN